MNEDTGVPFRPCDFEIEPFHTKLTGWIQAAVYEAVADEAKTIIGCDENWRVVVRWDIIGRLKHMLCGEFCIRVYLESIGPGPEIRVPGNGFRVQLDPCRTEPYEVTVNMTPNMVDCDECGTLYKLGVSLTTTDPCDNPGHIAGFCEGPTLMFYPQAHS